jgi:hypothetical protein
LKQFHLIGKRKGFLYTQVPRAFTTSWRSRATEKRQTIFQFHKRKSAESIYNFLPIESHWKTANDSSQTTKEAVNQRIARASCHPPSTL